MARFNLSSLLLVILVIAKERIALSFHAVGGVARPIPVRTTTTSTESSTALSQKDRILFSLSVAEETQELAPKADSSPWQDRFREYSSLPSVVVDRWNVVTTATAEWYSERPTPSWHVARAWCAALWQDYWWTFPLSLCGVPAVSLAAWQTPVTTPDFWKMVQMDTAATATSSPEGAALVVVACFLLSNLFYFGASGYLLYKLPPRKSRNSVSNLIPVPCRYSGLGFWTLAAALMSTIFHSFQALGDSVIAEGLCYLDHGIAISAILYFWHVCGKPTKETWILGGLGILALSLPIQPGYAFLHSTWHLLSAMASITWTQQGKTQHRQALLEAVRRKRNAAA